MKPLTICIVSFFLSSNILAQVEKEIATLEDSVKVNRALYGASHEKIIQSYHNLIELLYKHGQYKKLIKVSKNCNKFYIEAYGEMHQKMASLYNYTGLAFKNISKHKKAINYFIKALNLCQDLFKKNNLQAANIYNNLGDVYSSLNDYANSIQNYQKALDIYISLGNIDVFVAETYNNLGDVCAATCSYAKSNQCYQNALKIFQKVYGENNLEIAEIYEKLGAVFYEQAAYPNSIQNYKKSLEVYSSVLGEKNLSTANIYNKLSVVYRITGAHKKSFKYSNIALEIYKEVFSQNQPAIAETYKNFGSLYYATDDYVKSIEYYKKALAIYLKSLDKKHQLVAEIYNNLGTVYFAIDEYSKALQYYRKGIKIFENVLLEKHPSLAKAYNKIGEVCFATGDQFNAFQYFLKALEINIEILSENHTSTAQSFNNLGMLYRATGDYVKAKHYAQKALEINLKIFGEYHTSTALAYNNLGQVYSAMDDFSNAVKHFQKALKVRKEVLGLKHSSIANTYSSLGQLYLSESYFPKAIQYFQKVLKIRLKVFGEKHSLTAIAYSNLGEACLIRGDNQEAIEYFKRALRVYDKRHLNTIKTQTNLAYAYENSGKYNLANSAWNIIIPSTQNQLKENYLFLTENQKIIYLNTIHNRFSNFYHFSSRYGNRHTKLLAADLLLNSRAQILDYSISTRKLVENIQNGQIDSLAFQLSIINKKIAQAELLTKDEIKKKGWDLAKLTMLQDRYGAEISLHPKLDPKLNSAKITWQESHEKLQEDEAILGFYTFYDKIDSLWVYEALLIKKNDFIPIFVPLSAIKPANDLLQIRENTPLYLHYQTSRQELYNLIWKPLEPYLNRINTIYLTPITSLNKLDFESLQNEKNQYLADKYKFKYYTSFKDIFTQISSWSKKKYSTATLYGDINYYEKHLNKYIQETPFSSSLNRDTLRPLPATLQEIKAIETLCNKNKVSSTLLTLNEAKEDTIEFFSQDLAPSIIHFATHGTYLQPFSNSDQKPEMAALTGEDRFRAANNPLQRSLLMLSNAGEMWKKIGSYVISENDGILTALEVANLDLNNTKLVTLSACNSSIGSQHSTEGVFGLPRAFKLAGVDKILVSLWSVEDETTKELMILFYTNLLQKKQYAANALRNAKAEMRKRDDRPKKWAGFVLIE